MAKKVKVTLHAIVKEIDIVSKKLSQADVKSLTAAEKRQLATTIKSLKQAKRQVTSRCGKLSYALLVPSK